MLVIYELFLSTTKGALLDWLADKKNWIYFHDDKAAQRQSNEKRPLI